MPVETKTKYFDFVMASEIQNNIRRTKITPDKQIQGALGNIRTDMRILNLVPSVTNNPILFTV